MGSPSDTTPFTQPEFRVYCVFYRMGGDYVCHTKPHELAYVCSTREDAEYELNDCNPLREPFIVEASVRFHDVLPSSVSMDRFNAFRHGAEDFDAS
jgi:hypothetical protein